MKNSFLDKYYPQALTLHKYKIQNLAKQKLDGAEINTT